MALEVDTKGDKWTFIVVIVFIFLHFHKCGMQGTWETLGLFAASSYRNNKCFSPVITMVTYMKKKLWLKFGTSTVYISFLPVNSCILKTWIMINDLRMPSNKRQVSGPIHLFLLTSQRGLFIPLVYWSFCKAFLPPFFLKCKCQLGQDAVPQWWCWDWKCALLTTG